MTQMKLRSILLGISLIGNGTFALAQTAHGHSSHAHPTVGKQPAPVAAVLPPKPFAPSITTPITTAPLNTAAPASSDPHPFQSQVSIRIKANGMNDGMFQVIPAVTVAKYQYKIPGFPAMQTLENAALLYDKRNPLPGITLAGGNYNFYENGTVSTLDGYGGFYYLGKAFFEPAIIGGVYFTEKGTNNLIVVDSYGRMMSTFKPAPAIRVAGGNYFIDQSGVLTTIKSMGDSAGNPTNMVWTKECPTDGPKELWNFSGTKGTGGNYFLKADGGIVTVAASTGFVSFFTPSSRPKVFGGNYFIGEDNYLYTISSEGNLTQTDDFKLTEMPTIVGYSFMKFADGHLIMVDGKGMFHRSLMHVVSTNISADVVETLSGSIDPKSIYLPEQK